VEELESGIEQIAKEHSDQLRALGMLSPERFAASLRSPSGLGSAAMVADAHR
jgi:hypothetical protein